MPSLGLAAARQAVLTGKPVSSTGRGATARAQAHLRNGLAYTNGFVLPLPEVPAGVAGEKFDDDGNLTEPDTREEVRERTTSGRAGRVYGTHDPEHDCC